MWTVTITFGPGSVQVYKDLPKESAQRLISPALIAGCIEVTMSLQKQEDPRDQPDYPTE